jgi:hypothetical protein
VVGHPIRLKPALRTVHDSSARFQYNASHQLTNISDVAGSSAGQDGVVEDSASRRILIGLWLRIFLGGNKKSTVMGIDFSFTEVLTGSVPKISIDWPNSQVSPPAIVLKE